MENEISQMKKEHLIYIKDFEFSKLKDKYNLIDYKLIFTPNLCKVYLNIFKVSDTDFILSLKLLDLYGKETDKMYYAIKLDSLEKTMSVRNTFAKYLRGDHFLTFISCLQLLRDESLKA